MVVSQPVRLCFSAGTVVWIIASAEGQHLKPLSRAGSDAEIRARSLLSSRLFPHARIKVNSSFHRKPEVASPSVSGR